MRGLLLAGAVLALCAVRLGSGAARAGDPLRRTRSIPSRRTTSDHNLEPGAKDGYDGGGDRARHAGRPLESMDKIVLSELDAKLPVIVYVAPRRRTRRLGRASGSRRRPTASRWRRRRTSAPRRRSTRAAATSARDLRRKADQRRGGVATRARAEPRAERRSGPIVRCAEATNRDGAGSAAAERHRRGRADAPGAARAVDGCKTKPQGLHPAPRRRADRRRPPGFFTRLLNTLIDPNILAAALPRGPRGDRLRDLPSGSRAAGRARARSRSSPRCSASRCCPSAGAGCCLMLLGVALLVVDVHVPTHGALTLAGLISVAVGSIMLFQNAPAPYHTSKPLVIGVAVVLGGVWAFALSKAVQVRHRPVEVGPQLIAGAVGRGATRRARLRERRALAGAHLRRRAAAPGRAGAGRVARRARAHGPSTRQRIGSSRVNAALIIAAILAFLHRALSLRGDQGRSRVRARHHLPARPPAAAAEGPGPLPADPGRRPDGQGRPAHDHAERSRRRK